MSGRALRRIARVALAAVGAVLLMAVLAVLGLAGVWRASLPQLDGEVNTSAVSAPVLIERDDFGVPTLTAQNRLDLAFATGFVHGQDRFFEMDLSRRVAAGELAELVGAAALPLDRRARPYRFRALARAALDQMSGSERALLEAYARGVDAGLTSPASRPWEYWLLGSAPARWLPEDSFLVAYAMWWDLQQSDVRREQLRQMLRERLTPRALHFVFPERTAWDAPNVATVEDLRTEDALNAQPVEIPDAAALDVRGARSATVPRTAHADRGSTQAWPFEDAASVDLGSNNWAVAGRLTAGGAALVASDMHLGLRLPPVWYHARLRVLASAHTDELDLNGVTLPGEPAMIAGSNGHVAWAFTNSDGQWVDVHAASCRAGVSPQNAHEAALPFTTVTETLRVHGAAAERLAVRSGPLGLLFDTEPGARRCWFVRWLAQRPGATNLRLLTLERARSAEEVVALAPELGIPHQNLVVGDHAGHIAWALAGRVPRAREGGPEGGDASTGERSFVWRTAAEAPHLYDPPLGRVWSANARPATDAAALATIGAGEAAFGAQYTLGARARQIRDSLLTLPRAATPADMLRIQLDDRALFLARWRTLLLELLDARALAEHPRRGALRAQLAAWDGTAGVDAVGYRLVQAFHERTEVAVWEMLLEATGIAADDPPPQQFEQPLWALVTRQPLHLLSAAYPSWRDFLLRQADATIEDLTTQCGELTRCRWGAAYPVQIRHPLSRAVPMLARWLDLPPLELPGDHHMPRVQQGAMGASERFAVAPGEESRGYLHLPGGQSGHPLSPYYRKGYEAWARGEPLPLLPGAARHRLTLRPPHGL